MSCNNCDFYDTKVRKVDLVKSNCLWFNFKYEKRYGINCPDWRVHEDIENEPIAKSIQGTSCPYMRSLLVGKQNINSKKIQIPMKKIKLEGKELVLLLSVLTAQKNQIEILLNKLSEKKIELNDIEYTSLHDFMISYMSMFNIITSLDIDKIQSNALNGVEISANEKKLYKLYTNRINNMNNLYVKLNLTQNK
jgi:hypothetical protein